MARLQTGEVSHGDEAPRSYAINPPLILDMRRGPSGRRNAKLTKEDKIDLLFRRCRKAERKLATLGGA